MPCHLQSALVGSNSLPRPALFLVRVLASGVEGRGPARRVFCESRQDRKVAAAAERFLVLQSALPELAAEMAQGKDGRSRVHGPLSSKPRDQMIPSRFSWDASSAFVFSSGGRIGRRAGPP